MGPTLLGSGTGSRVVNTTTGRFFVGPVATIVMLLIVSTTGGVAADGPEGSQTPSGFLDVPDGYVFETESTWLASTGITQGPAGDSFGLNDAVTCGAMAAFLYRYDQYLTEPTPEPGPEPEPQLPATNAQHWLRVSDDETVVKGHRETQSVVARGSGAGRCRR